MFERILSKLERISRFGVWMGGGALMIAAFIVTIDVLFRKFVGWTMSGSDEITSYVFAASTTWAYSFVLLHRANVRIDAAYNLVKPKVRAVLDVLGVMLLLLYMGTLTERAIVVVQDSIAYGSVSNTTLLTPLWIPQLAWASGLVFFMITLIVVATYSIVMLLRGDFAGVNRVAGVMTVTEEIDTEIHGMEFGSDGAAGDGDK